jgi:phosphoglycerate dehydrogenase-like enzyme
MENPRIGVMIEKPLRDRLFTASDMQRLNRLGDVAWTESETPLTQEQAMELLADCRIAVGSWKSPLPSAELLRACPHLILWEHAAGSVKHMFGPHLAESDLVVACCKPALADVVAEMTLGQIILGLRRVFENAADNKTAVVGHPPQLRVLMGSTVGVVGASLTGRRVIRLLQPFGCEILVYDPYVSADEIDRMGATKTDRLIDLCAASDVVTLHTPDIPATRKMIGSREMAVMKDDAIFINTSRGACIDEAALVCHLQRGRLTAFLDVSWPEPTPIDSPLRRLPNAFYTSHIAGPPCFNLGRQAVNDIEAFVTGGVPEYIFTPAMLTTTA